MKTRTKAVKAPIGPTKPLIFPNHFPGMCALGDLIYDYEQFFQSGQPTQQAMFDQFWRAFDDLWNSVNNYMGNPPFPSLKQARNNLAYLQSVARDDRERQAAIELEAEIYVSRRSKKAA
jgi:hypothetical protein